MAKKTMTPAQKKAEALKKKKTPASAQKKTMTPAQKKAEALKKKKGFVPFKKKK